MYYNYLPNMGHCGFPGVIPQYHHFPCCEPSSTIVNINIPPCPGGEPEPEPLNLDSLTIGVDKNGEMRNTSTGELTGLKLKDCIETISSAKHNLKIDGKGKLEGKCEEDRCQKCVDAINSAVIETKKENEEKVDKDQETPNPENLYFMDAQIPVEDNIAIIF